MIRILIPFILVILAFILAKRYINAAPIEQQKSRKINVVLIALTIGLLILTLLHRMHWLGTLVPAFIFAGQKFIGFLSKIFPSKKPNSDQKSNKDP